MTTPHTAAEIEKGKQQATMHMENGVILQLHKAAEGTRRLTSILAVGYADANMTAAIIEFRSAANLLEDTQRRYRDTMAEIDRAIQLADQGRQGE